MHLLARRVARAIKRALAPDGLMIFQLNGAAAGQTVFHYHAHLIPRQQGSPLSLHGRQRAEPTRARRARAADRRGARVAVGGALLAAPLAIEAWALRRGAPEAEVVRIGMGPRRTLRALDRLRARRPAAVAVAGVCGAIDPSLVPGDVLVADALLGPGGERVALASAALVAALARHGIDARTGAVASVERLFGGPSRASLAERGACAVEMESFWLAPLARDCAFAVLRVVSDGPGHELLRPGIVRNGVRALRRLRATAPALAEWAAEAASGA